MCNARREANIDGGKAILLSSLPNKGEWMSHCCLTIEDNEVCIQFKTPGFLGQTISIPISGCETEPPQRLSNYALKFISSDLGKFKQHLMTNNMRGIRFKAMFRGGMTTFVVAQTAESDWSTLERHMGRTHPEPLPLLL